MTEETKNVIITKKIVIFVIMETMETMEIVNHAIPMTGMKSLKYRCSTMMTKEEEEMVGMGMDRVMVMMDGEENMIVKRIVGMNGTKMNVLHAERINLHVLIHALRNIKNV